MSTEPLDAIDVEEAAFDDANEVVICDVKGGSGGSWLYCWQNSCPGCWGISWTLNWRVWLTGSSLLNFDVFLAKYFQN